MIDEIFSVFSTPAMLLSRKLSDTIEMISDPHFDALLSFGKLKSFITPTLYMMKPVYVVPTAMKVWAMSNVSSNYLKPLQFSHRSFHLVNNSVNL